MLQEYPALASRLPATAGQVDSLSLGVATVHVRKGRSAVRQGRFVGPHHVTTTGESTMNDSHPEVLDTEIGGEGMTALPGTFRSYPQAREWEADDFGLARYESHMRPFDDLMEDPDGGGAEDVP